MSNAAHPGSLPVPALVLAADHRARGVITIEDYRTYTAALSAALAHCDGILASAQPLGDLSRDGSIGAHHRTYLSVNRTGLAGSAFELDDRLVASVHRAAEEGWTGVKHMTRIDRTDPLTAGALELLGQVLEEARTCGIEALVEPVVWRDGAMATGVDDVVYAAVVAHDLGAPLLKVPVPDAEAGSARTDAVARVVASVGVPVLFLGGPRRSEDGGGDPLERVLVEAEDVMAGGGAGMAIGRALYQEPRPDEAARRMAEVVHGSATGGAGSGSGSGSGR